jgi:hypothetical protein
MVDGHGTAGRLMNLCEPGAKCEATRCLNDAVDYYVTTYPVPEWRLPEFVPAGEKYLEAGRRIYFCEDHRKVAMDSLT